MANSSSPSEPAVTPESVAETAKAAAKAERLHHKAEQDLRRAAQAKLDMPGGFRG